MSGSITIRPLCDADLEGVVSLYNRGGFGPAAGGHPLLAHDFCRSLEERSTLLFLVAASEEQQAIVGTLGLFRVSDQVVARPKEVFASNFFIHPEFRNGRIPNQLFIAALRKLLAEGYDCISTTVNPANIPAMSLYKRVGLYRTRSSKIDYDGQLELRGFQPLIMRAIKQSNFVDIEAVPRRESSWRFLRPTQAVRDCGYDSEYWNGLEVITYEMEAMGQKIIFRVDVLSNGIVSMETAQVHFHMYPLPGQDLLAGDEVVMVFELTNTSNASHRYQVSYPGDQAREVLLPWRVFQAGETWRQEVPLKLQRAGTHILHSILHMEQSSIDFQVGVRVLLGLSAQRMRPLQPVAPGELIQFPLRLTNAYSHSLNGRIKVTSSSLTGLDCQPIEIAVAAHGETEVTIFCAAETEGAHTLLLEVQDSDGKGKQAEPIILPALTQDRAVLYQENDSYILENAALRVCIDKNTGYLQIWDKGSEKLAMNEAWPDTGPPLPGGIKRSAERIISKVESVEEKVTLHLQEQLSDGGILERSFHFLDNHLLEIHHNLWRGKHTGTKLKTYGWCAFRKDMLTVPLKDRRSTEAVIYGAYPYALHDFDSIPSPHLPRYSSEFAGEWSTFTEGELTAGALWSGASEICYGLHWLPALIYTLPEVPENIALPSYAYYVGPGGEEAVAYRWGKHYGKMDSYEPMPNAPFIEAQPPVLRWTGTVGDKLRQEMQVEPEEQSITITETSQRPGYSIDNGILRLQVATEFAGSIYNLTYKGTNILQSALARSRPFGENGIWYGGIHPYIVESRTSLRDSILCDVARQLTFQVKPVKEDDSDGKTWQGVALAAGDLCMTYETTPGLPLLRLGAEFHNSQSVTQTFDMVFHIFLRSQGNRTAKTLYYERAGRYYSLQEEQRNRKVYTDDWSVVTIGKEIAVAFFAPAEEERVEIATYEWPNDGFQHALIQAMHVAPGQTQRVQSYVLITDSQEQALRIAQSFRRAETSGENVMRIVFVALSRGSLGELHNAICVAQQLIQRGAEVLFLTLESQQKYAKAAGMQVKVMQPKLRQREMLREVVEDFRADALVLADYYILDLETELIDLDALDDLPVPCATFDSLGFAPGARILENQLVRPQDERHFRGKFNRFVNIRALPEHIQVMRTCPVNAPVQMDPRMLPIKLYAHPFTIASERRREVRRSLGVQCDAEKLVMFAKATWASLNVKYRMIQAAGHSGSVTYSYETYLQDMLVHYLADIDTPVTVLGVTSHVDRGAAARSQGHIRFVNMPFLNMEEFAELLFSCDLFVADNITSSAMARAVFANVPVLTLINTELTGTQDASELTMPPSLKFNGEQNALIQKWNRLLPGGIYPFHTYPNGWIAELTPLFHDNPYNNAIERAEMYAIDETTRCFTELLCNDTSIASLQARQQAYMDQIIALPDTYDIFSTWLAQATKKGVTV